MKNLFLLLILQALLIGCLTPKTQNPLPTEHNNSVVQTVAVRENIEYLDWQSMRINGKLPLITTVNNINSLLGKPDIVTTIDWTITCPSSFKNEDSKLAYYGGFKFEKFGDSLNFQTVDFRKNQDVFLQSNDLKLNSSTTLEEIKKRFPYAAMNIKKMNVYGVGEVETIAVPPSKINSDGHWLLMFQNEKLIRIDDWFPC